MEYHAVSKITIQMKEKNPELEQALLPLKLCRESNDSLWKEMISYQRNDSQILESREGKKIQYEIRRKLKYDP